MYHFINYEISINLWYYPAASILYLSHSYVFRTFVIPTFCFSRVRSDEHIWSQLELAWTEMFFLPSKFGCLNPFCKSHRNLKKCNFYAKLREMPEVQNRDHRIIPWIWGENCRSSYTVLYCAVSYETSIEKSSEVLFDGIIDTCNRKQYSIFLK